MTVTIDELRRKARYAGFLYLLGSLPAPIGLLYVPGKLIVAGDAATTADNIPRVLGVLMMIAGAGYLVSSATTILLPEYAHQVGQVTLILGLGELPIMFWLLIWGARVQSSSAPAA